MNEKTTPFPQLPKRYIIPNKIGPYQLLEVIGEGSFSQVRVAIHEITQERYACKIVAKKRIECNGLEEKFESEIRLLQQMNHPNIIHIIQLLKDSLNYYVILEYCPHGQLFNYIHKVKKIPEDEARAIFYQICRGVAHIHGSGIVHRDLKPENILIYPNGMIKIIDFGFSAQCKPNSILVTRCGSPSYAAPELIMGKPYNGHKADIWSLGVILYAILFGQIPWTKKNQTQMINQIINGDYYIPDLISNSCHSLLSSMLKTNPEDRPNINQILYSEWFNNIESISYPMQDFKKLLSNDSIDYFFEKLQPVEKHTMDLEILDEQSNNVKKLHILEGKGLLVLARRKSVSSKCVVTLRRNRSSYS